jgi:hypothetical protein
MKRVARTSLVVALCVLIGGVAMRYLANRPDMEHVQAMVPPLQPGSRIVFVPPMAGIPVMELSSEASERFAAIVRREPELLRLQPRMPLPVPFGAFTTANVNYEWFGEYLGVRVSTQYVAIWRSEDIDRMRQTMADAGWDMSEEVYHACLEQLVARP